MKNTLDICADCDRIKVTIKRRCKKMPYSISEDCIECGACAAECPVEAITPGDGKYVIDPDKCISCGACAGTCPVGAPQEK